MQVNTKYQFIISLYQVTTNSRSEQLNIVPQSED
jgi:hypothetical protein